MLLISSYNNLLIIINQNLSNLFSYGKLTDICYTYIISKPLFEHQKSITIMADQLSL